MAGGRSSPQLGVVSGREADVVGLPDGSTLAPYQLTMALEAVAGLAQFQVMQAERELFRVLAIADGVHAGALEHDILLALRRELPRSIRVEVAIVERLEHGARAKVRVVQQLSRAGNQASALAGTGAGSR